MRAVDISIAMVCSAAEMMLLSGTFATRTPFLVALSTSMLSTPIPARPITLRRDAAPMASASTLVPLRTTRPS